MNAQKRILIIGLDGFTWRVADRLLQEGKMPALREFVNSGSYGTLKSVIPFETSPAWVGFQTGCNPAKTGIFAFHGFSRQTGQIKLNSASDILVPTIWEILNDAGKKVISINMPMTSPPPRINGVIIPGLTCPELSSRTVSPPHIFEKYIRHNPDYLIVNNARQPTLADYVTQSIRAEETRCDLALQLMREEDWDVFAIQIQSTDAFQHQYWWALDPHSEGFAEEHYSSAAALYAKVDAIIHRLTRAAGKSTLTVIVSDHGFCAKNADIGINAWLQQNGFLFLRDSDNAFRKAVRKVKASVPTVKCAARLYGRILRFFSQMKPDTREKKSAMYSERVVKHIRETIDLERTFAFSLGGMAGLLYILDNTKNDEAQRMTEQLLNLYGPTAANPCISKIERIDHSCETSQNNYPDYIITLAEGVEARISPEGDSVIHPGTSDGKQNGTHDQNGMFIIHHPEAISEHLRLDASIVDMLPTILAYLGIPIPSHIDGRVLTEVFRTRPSINYDQNTPFARTDDSDYSATQQSEVEKRLADLGYI